MGDALGNYFKKSYLFAYDGVSSKNDRVAETLTLNEALKNAGIDDDTVVIYNNAQSGETSSDFLGLTDKQKDRNGTHWDNLLKNVEPGDYVFISFGHNDQTKVTNEQYIANLTEMITDVRNKYANPVLYTPIVRLRADGEGLCGDNRFSDNEHGDKLKALKDLATEKGVPLIDLTARSQEYIRSLGNDYDTQYQNGLKLYMQDVIDNNSNYAGLNGALDSRYVNTAPNGVALNWGGLTNDITHTTRFGADVYASLFAKEIKDNPALSALAGLLKDDLTTPVWNSYEAYYNK